MASTRLFLSPKPFETKVLFYPYVTRTTAPPSNSEF
jgi:hypothetical protein